MAFLLWWRGGSIAIAGALCFLCRRRASYNHRHGTGAESHTRQEQTLKYAPILFKKWLSFWWTTSQYKILKTQVIKQKPVKWTGFFVRIFCERVSPWGIYWPMSNYQVEYGLDSFPHHCVLLEHLFGNWHLSHLHIRTEPKGKTWKSSPN